MELRTTQLPELIIIFSFEDVAADDFSANTKKYDSHY